MDAELPDSPLTAIRHREQALAERLEAARREADADRNRAQIEAETTLARVREAADLEAQTLFAETIALAEAQAASLIQQARARAENLQIDRQKRIESIANLAISWILPIVDETEQSEGGERRQSSPAAR